MTGTLDKRMLVRYLEEQIDAIDKYIGANGKNNIYYTTMDRDRAVINSIITKICAGKFDC